MSKLLSSSVNAFVKVLARLKLKHCSSCVTRKPPWPSLHAICFQHCGNSLGKAPSCLNVKMCLCAKQKAKSFNKLGAKELDLNTFGINYNVDNQALLGHISAKHH